LLADISFINSRFASTKYHLYIEIIKYIKLSLPRIEPPTLRLPFVLDNRARIFPRSSLLGAGQVGFWEFGKGGSTGGRVGQTGSVYKQPEREVDNSYHNWRVPSK
jgi:hypothetical protein